MVSNSLFTLQGICSSRSLKGIFWGVRTRFFLALTSGVAILRKSNIVAGLNRDQLRARPTSYPLSPRPHVCVSGEVENSQRYSDHPGATNGKFSPHRACFCTSVERFAGARSPTGPAPTTPSGLLALLLDPERATLVPAQGPLSLTAFARNLVALAPFPRSH